MKLFYTLAAALLFAACQAALPPAAMEELMANAEEVLLIRVETVDTVESGCMPRYNLGTQIIAVNQTTNGLTSGNILSFGSYSLDRESMGCGGWVGPTPPPKLEAGWCGYVYLNKRDDGDMGLAAYGESFQQAPEEACAVEIPSSHQSAGSTLLKTLVDTSRATHGASLPAFISAGIAMIGLIVI